jgi:NodT family efflux transporter outer membrane factor (OMF) lipoprotein
MAVLYSRWCNIHYFCSHVTTKLLVTISSLILLTGCQAVGPDYIPPETNAPAQWHTELRQELTAENNSPEKLAEWWTIFDDPVLTALVTEAISNNLDVKQALVKIREARARRGKSQAGFFPVIDTSGSASRSKGSENSGSGLTRNHFSLGFDASWEIDVFGGVRRSVEANEADFDASQENLRYVLVSLTAEVVLNYLDIRTTQKRLAIAKKNLAIQQETFDFTSWRCQAGLSNELALQQSLSNLESTRAQIPVLNSKLEEAKNRLAVLMGKTPGSIHPLVDESMPIPVIPPAVAVGVPAETLRQRPDISKAERNLAAQTARIGVATADLYPRFRLSGSIGLDSLKAADLFNTGSNTMSIVPGVSWNMFDAGAIRQNIEVQSAIQEQYLLTYEAAILTALEEVENALYSFAEEQVRRERLVAAVDSARQAQELTAQQYSAGLIDFTDVLITQRSLLSLDDQLAQSDGKVTSNLIRLYKALGGGWSSPATEQILQGDKYYVQ